MKSLLPGEDMSWLILGDFNELLNNEEKRGGRIRPEAQMEQFRLAVDHCNLKDLKFSRSPFIWCNRRGSDQNIPCQHNFTSSSIVHGYATTSDHTAQLY